MLVDRSLHDECAVGRGRLVAEVASAARLVADANVERAHVEQRRRLVGRGQLSAHEQLAFVGAVETVHESALAQAPAQFATRSRNVEAVAVVGWAVVRVDRRDKQKVKNRGEHRPAGCPAAFTQRRLCRVR